MHFLDSLIVENLQKILRTGAELWKPTIFEPKIRAYSSSLMCVIVACMGLPFFKIFSNFVHFCPNFQIFCPFLPFFSKIASMPLLSRIIPAKWPIFPKQYFFRKTNNTILMYLLASFIMLFFKKMIWALRVSYKQRKKTKRKSVGGNKVPRGSLHKSRTLANKEHQ